MIKRFCDKCEKEIKHSCFKADIYEYGYDSFGFKNDLCMDCAIEVQNFIKPRDDVEERIKQQKLILEPKERE